MAGPRPNLKNRLYSPTGINTPQLYPNKKRELTVSALKAQLEFASAKVLSLAVNKLLYIYGLRCA